MFDIKIGTLVPACEALNDIEILNGIGYESYELNLWSGIDAPMLADIASRLKDKLDGRVVSALAVYANPFSSDDDIKYLQTVIKSCRLFDCNTVGFFVGSARKSVEEMIPLFKNRFSDTVKLAEDNGVRLAMENCSCGGSWYSAPNLAFCPEAWDMIFNEIDSPSLGLEWEPSHMIRLFVDPIANLRKYARKVYHVHGKDATVAWDVIREYGIQTSKPFAWDRTPGFGDSNWADIFTILLQNGFEGSCDIEGYHDPVHFDDMEWTAQKTAVDYLKRCRGGISFVQGPSDIPGFQGKRKH